eukprot:scaffold83818_cov35-Tisochrysis_lutea.AAC.1
MRRRSSPGGQSRAFVRLGCDVPTHASAWPKISSPTRRDYVTLSAGGHQRERINIYASTRKA